MIHDPLPVSRFASVLGPASPGDAILRLDADDWDQVVGWIATVIRTGEMFRVRRVDGDMACVDRGVGLTRPCEIREVEEIMLVGMPAEP